MKVFKSLIVLISMISCCMLSSCNFKNNNSIISTNENVVTNTDGFVVEGNNIEEGTKLESKKVEKESQEGISVINSLSSQTYDKSKDVYIYDIHLEKDGNEIQPNGNVKVKIPFVVEENSYYVVFHIKDNSDVEKLTPIIDSNYIVIETSSFSYFAIAHEKRVDESTKYNFKVEVNDLTKGTITENDITVDYSSGKEVTSGSQITLTAVAEEGYALKGWYIIEGSEETLLSCATTYTFTIDSDISVKAIFDEKVTIYINTDGRMMGTINSLGSLIFKIKGVTVEKHSDFVMYVAKGTEVTIEAIPCEGWQFSEWYYRYSSDNNSTLLTTNSVYTFIAEQDVSFRAWGNGIPDRLEFSSSTKISMENYRGYTINQDGCYEKTVTVGTKLEDYTDVRLWLYYADDNNTFIECYYDNGLDNQFAVDDSQLDVNKVGRYEIKYIFIGWYPEGQEPVTLSIFINVVAAN